MEENQKAWRKNIQSTGENQQTLLTWHWAQGGSNPSRIVERWALPMLLILLWHTVYWSSISSIYLLLQFCYPKRKKASSWPLGQYKRPTPFNAQHVPMVSMGLAPLRNLLLGALPHHQYFLDIYFPCKLLLAFFHSSDTFLQFLSSYHIYMKTSCLSLVIIIQALIEVINEYRDSVKHIADNLPSHLPNSKR